MCVCLSFSKTTMLMKKVVAQSSNGSPGVELTVLFVFPVCGTD